MPDTVSVQPAALLRRLLDSPKPKDEAWQAEAGRAVSMLAVGVLKEADDVSALRSVALLGLAQSAGVKEARKRAIKLSRWAASAPPSLVALPQKDEQEAALAALAKLATAPWARRYAEQALADPSLPEEFSADLLKWARATCADSLSFIREFYAPQVAAARTGTRATILLKDAARLLKPSGPEVAGWLAEGVAALVEAFLQAAQTGAADDKAFGGGVAALLHLAQDQAAAAPAVLLQPSFARAFGKLAGVGAKGASAKQVAAAADVLSLATISLLVADLERHGSQASDHWRAMLPTWRAAYATWDASIASAAKLSPALATLGADRTDGAQGASDAYASEAVFARLLPAWDAYVAELPDPSRAVSLSAMLRQAAGSLGIAPLGEKGAVVSYDPLSHHLAEEGAEPPERVRVLRPGVQVHRPDGSARVLVTALVAAA